MSGFSEAWLADYRARQHRPIAVRDVVVFTLPEAILSGNRLLRMSFIDRMKYARAMSTEIARQIPVTRYAPIERASVTIVRHALRLLDHDGLVMAAKPLVDCLMAYSKTHPTGLGIVVDDDPAHISVSYHQELVRKRVEQRTDVRIERVA